jgi:DNA-binding NarL/FixJ family response regulator
MVQGVRQLLIVEDEPMVAALLQDSLVNEGFDIRIAHSVSEAVAITKQFDPDFAILDINLGRGANGVELAYILSKQNLGIGILFLTHNSDLRTAGFEERDLPEYWGFLRKDAVVSKNDILESLNDLVQRHDRGGSATLDPNRPLSKLTRTQVDVLRMVAQGYTNEEIAKRRIVSVRAVEQVLNNIFANLGIEKGDGINTRVEAVRRFISAAGSPDRI